LKLALIPELLPSGWVIASPSLVMNTYGHVTERMQTEATATLERVLGA